MSMYEVSVVENIRFLSVFVFWLCIILYVISFVVYMGLCFEKETALSVFHKKIVLGIVVAITALVWLSATAYVLTPNSDVIEILKLKAVSNG